MHRRCLRVNGGLLSAGLREQTDRLSHSSGSNTPEKVECTTRDGLLRPRSPFLILEVISMQEFQLTDDHLAHFHADGYLLVERLFDGEEIGLLRTIARADHELVERAASRRDGQGG